ncbi:MAG: hypothetical protein JO063_11230 [Pseudonocardiales bacterium]|nr:hypothetical protein [Pseudonocardiales bacterium]MBW0010670.1 hypothetical protein [Pseudonocardiales bacterium]
MSGDDRGLGSPGEYRAVGEGGGRVTWWPVVTGGESSMSHAGGLRE